METTTTTTAARHDAQRERARRPRPRRQQVRGALAVEAVARYNSGESIERIAYAFQVRGLRVGVCGVRSALVRHGVTLRPRGRPARSVEVTA